MVVKATLISCPTARRTLRPSSPNLFVWPSTTVEPGKSSIRHELDFVLTKRTTDVLVVGHAHAPQGHGCDKSTWV